MSRKLVTAFFPIGLAMLSLAGLANADEPQTASPVSTMRQAPAVRVARLVEHLNTRSDSRRSFVPVFRDEADFVNSNATAPHQQAHFYTSRYDYTPDCRCDDAGFADGLWAGYCETRRTSWYSNWLLKRWRGNCECSDCFPKSDK